MAITIGTYGATDATGWTTITASGTPQYGYNTGAPASGNTMVIYVSSTGSDSTSSTEGSAANPYLTLAKGFSRLRDGQPDWLLLKKGDTWTHQVLGSNVSGLSATAPMVFGSYDPANPTVINTSTGGARPLVKTSSADGNLFSATVANKGDFLAFVGIEFYGYTRDPVNNAGSYSAADGVNGQVVIQVAGSSKITFMLIEDCKVSYHGFAFDPGVTAGTISGNNLYIRRNIIHHCWNANSTAYGMYFDEFDNVHIEENILDSNGRNESLVTTANTTVALSNSGGNILVTWPTTPLFIAGTSIGFVSANDSNILLTSAFTTYVVLNVSGNTFNIATQGAPSTPVAYGSGTTGVAVWIGSQGNDQSHNIYDHQLNTYGGNVFIRGNVSTRGGANDTYRTGGTVFNNFYSDQPFAFIMGNEEAGGGVSVTFHATMTYNVCVNANDFHAASTSGEGYWIENATGPDITFKNNIAAHSVSTRAFGNAVFSDVYTSNCTITNNLVYDWAGNTINDHGTGNTTTPNTTSGTFADGYRTGASYYATLSGSVANNSFTGTITSGVLTVSAFSGTSLQLGDAITYSGQPNSVIIRSFGTGTGGNGTYNVVGVTAQLPFFMQGWSVKQLLSAMYGLSRANWNADLIGPSVNSYIRSGFGIADPGGGVQPATHLSVTAPAAATSGTPIAFTVTALDASNATAVGYSGTVAFTSTDAAATLPPNVSLTGGVGGFSATLVTVGAQDISASDVAAPSIAGTSPLINVTAVSPGPGPGPGPVVATHFLVSAPTGAKKGTSFSFSVTALDSANATVTDYAGTMHFASTDAAAVLPADATLVAGKGSFSAKFNTAGSQRISATDTVTSSITGTSNVVNVTTTTGGHTGGGSGKTKHTLIP